MKTYLIQHQSGGRATLPMQQQQKIFGGGDAKQPEVPKAIPPATVTSTEVTDAQRQARLAAAKRNGMQSTLLAGADTGTGTDQNVGGASLLG